MRSERGRVERGLLVGGRISFVSFLRGYGRWLLPTRQVQDYGKCAWIREKEDRWRGKKEWRKEEREEIGLSITHCQHVQKGEKREEENINYHTLGYINTGEWMDEVEWERKVEIGWGNWRRTGREEHEQVNSFQRIFVYWTDSVQKVTNLRDEGWNNFSWVFQRNVPGSTICEKLLEVSFSRMSGVYLWNKYSWRQRCLVIRR